MKKAATHLSRFFATASAATLLGCGGGATTNTNLEIVDPAEPVSDWTLVWSDEFDGTSIDAKKWTHEVDCAGGGNNEAQCYTDSAANSFVANGALNIVALPAEEGAEKPYTSARLNTRYKADFQYGRIEMRAKLPSGQGSWPAFWMMPTDEVYGGWPKSGEIDIMEAVNLGAEAADQDLPENRIYGTLHYGSGPAEGDHKITGMPYALESGANPADDFHTYAIEWQEGEIRWYMDGYLYATQRRSTPKTNSDGEITGLKHRGWYAEYYDQATGELTVKYDNAPFDQDFYLILNLAIGGDWPVNVNETGIDEEAFANGQTFAIDYVRVYQCSQDPDTGKGCETVRPGYDSLDDALLEGEAPIPVVSSGEPDPVTVLFGDELGANLSFDSYNPDGFVSYDVVAEAGRGNVLQMVKTGATGNLYFTAATPFDLSAYGDIGELIFDVKVDSSDGSTLYVKFDSGWPNVSDIPVEVPVDGEWHTITINIAELLARENTYSPGSLANPESVTNIFVAEPTGAMTVSFDNIRLEYPSTTKVTTLYDDVLADDLTYDSYNPDGFVTYDPAVAETDRGNVIEVVKTGATGNFYFTAASPYDLTTFGEYGELVFDLYVTSADAGVELLVKFDSGWPNVSDTAVVPTIGEWVTVRLNIVELLANENRFSPGSYAIPDSVSNIFVVEPTGAMSFKMDNIRLEKPPAPVETMLYDDSLAADLSFDSYNPDSAISYAEVAETDRGVVLEVTKTGATGNVYFTPDEPYDLTGWGDQSEVVFDVKVTSKDAASELLVKLDSGWPNVSDVTVTLPTEGEWGEVRLNITELLANGNRYDNGAADRSNLTNVFVIEPTGPMVVSFDNIRFIKR